MSPTQQKILLLLSAGLEFGYTYSPGKKRRVIERAFREWHDIDAVQLRRELNNLYRSQSIGKRSNADGTFSIFLTEKGRIKTLKFDFSEKKKLGWDKKWRLVAFDVPETARKGRNALRWKLKEIGFYELQRSVFVFPYDCLKEIDFIISFFKMERYVRYGILESVSNEIELKKLFGL